MVNKKNSGIDIPFGALVLILVVCIAVIVILIVLLIVRKGQKVEYYYLDDDDGANLKETDVDELIEDKDGTTHLMFSNVDRHGETVNKASHDTNRPVTHKNNGKTIILININNRHERHIVELYSSPVTIGRSKKKSMVVIAGDASISGLHCEMCFRDSILTIRDRGSLNGTWVNGKRAGLNTMVSDGDTIQLGNSKYIVEVH